MHTMNICEGGLKFPACLDIIVLRCIQPNKLWEGLCRLISFEIPPTTLVILGHSTNSTHTRRAPHTHTEENAVMSSFYC